MKSSHLSLILMGSFLMTTTALIHPGMADTPPTPLTAERVFADPDLSGPKAVGAKLSPDGKLLTFLKPKTENHDIQDLWAVPVKGGEPFLLVDANSLSSSDKALSEAEKSRRERMRVSSRGVVDYGWSDDSKSILVPLDGDVYLVDVASKAVKRITETTDDEVDAKLSPKGDSVSFVRNQTLFLHDIASGAETKVSPDGAYTIAYGTAEFIAQEELDRYTGYWWNPKGGQIAYEKYDESNVPIAERVEIGGRGCQYRPSTLPLCRQGQCRRRAVHQRPGWHGRRSRWT